MNYSQKSAALLCVIALAGLTSCKNNSQNFSNTESVCSTAVSTQITTTAEIGITYIINVNTGKFHCTDCPSVELMNESNKKKYVGDRDDLVSKGYKPCKKCKP